MSLREQIMKLQTYKMFEDKDTVYIERDDILKLLEQQTCEKCISRNAIIKTLNEMDRYIADKLILCDSDNKFPQNEVFIVDDVYEKIDELLPVTPQPKTGHWILDETDNSITCDKCGCLIWANDISNGEAYYCPNCGAYMSESEDKK